jgi:hypothetical protein
LRKSILFILVTPDDWMPEDNDVMLINIMVGARSFNPQQDQLIITVVDTNLMPGSVEIECFEWLPELRHPDPDTIYWHNKV